MNSLWSENVQGIMTLYLSRKLRFDEMFAEQYQKLFGLDPDKPLRILEIGCGPGALAEALQRWYPKAEIVGVDRDTNFIEFAKKNNERNEQNATNIAPLEKDTADSALANTASGSITFLEGDATSLPFPDDSFDVTISYTVQEHVESSAFFGEQRRVLKPGGICLCLSARKGIRAAAKCLDETEAERAFWAQQPSMEDEFQRCHVREYAMTESELPKAMEQYGFRNVAAGYAVIDLTPDDPKYPPEMAEAMIEAERQGDLEAIASTRAAGSELVADVVNAKYDERLRLYRAGIKQWDTTVSVNMIVRGVK